MKRNKLTGRLQLRVSCASVISGLINSQRYDSSHFLCVLNFLCLSALKVTFLINGYKEAQIEQLKITLEPKTGNDDIFEPIIRDDLGILLCSCF